MSAALDWKLNSRHNEGSKRAIHGPSLHRHEHASTPQTRNNTTCFAMPTAQALLLPPDLGIALSCIRAPYICARCALPLRSIQRFVFH